jgi:hypothetical protein
MLACERYRALQRWAKNTALVQSFDGRSGARDARKFGATVRDGGGRQAELLLRPPDQSVKPVMRNRPGRQRGGHSAPLTATADSRRRPRRGQTGADVAPTGVPLLQSWTKGQDVTDTDDLAPQTLLNTCARRCQRRSGDDKSDRSGCQRRLQALTFRVRLRGRCSASRNGARGGRGRRDSSATAVSGSSACPPLAAMALSALN